MSLDETHSDFNSLLTRYLSGELTAEELDAFDKILASDTGKRTQVEEYRKIWESMGSPTREGSYDLDAEWGLLQEKIQGSSRSLLFYTYRIAAVLVVGLLLTFGWIKATQIIGTELIVAKNEPVEVILEDGTHVMVNRNSRLRIQKKFEASQRKVYLSGEAWFDVARDTTRPFLIDVETAIVEVLGTSFNVNAYKENPSVEITVKTGMVALTAKQDHLEKIILKAGNGGTYNKESKQLKLIPSSNPNSIAWKTRALYFDHSSLKDVVDLVNQVYNARLVIINPELDACTITVAFRDQSLDAVLNVLELTLDLEITRAGGEIRLDGEGCGE